MESGTMNHCQPYWEAYPDPTMNPITISIFTTLYSLIFVFSLVGNLIVMIVTLKNRVLQSVQNIFLLNLAASDIMMCLLSIPLTPITLIMKEWYFGGFACKLVSFIQALSSFISTFNRPLRQKQAVLMVITIWILSAAVSTPYVYYITLKSYPNICGYFCTETWPSEQSKRTYTFLVLIIQFAIPLTVLALCYHSIFSFLAQRARCRIISITKQTDFLSLLASASRPTDNQHQEQLTYLSRQKKQLWRHKKRATILLAVTVTIFGLTALPNNISSLIYDYDTDASLLTVNGYDFFYLINLFTHCMMTACCVANPILYAFLNPEFRKSLMRRRLYAKHTLQAARSFPT
ncbi:unnamed protein product [Enterobius vermicularis]|uniref:G_PROTEIN_RECEP_F1_2 domain-containing protein n=1 Tax=Enterobius vermicularis TaxID=51028 RepID=A0A0N4VIJ8_ENTVE|nr:unnamed protein product [Enterobius vermicularis]